MAVIGITGGAGTGKSFVAKLASENFDMLHIDTDKLARTQMMPGGVAYAGVAEAFPDCLADPGAQAGNGSQKTQAAGNGSQKGQAGEDELPLIDRGALAKKVFNNSELLEKLNSLTHPYVREAVETLIKTSEGLFDHVLIETAILADAGYCPICDAVWLVTAPVEDRIKRLKERGYDEERIRSVFASQPTDERYKETSTYVIENGEDADKEKILAQLRDALSFVKTEERPDDDDDDE
ncbi:MAG: dephospho-CoA kinase [Lachnospiraceae bacterium]|nr:dephospho-CoA kinase [Lachnospiraceae bacterium]